MQLCVCGSISLSPALSLSVTLFLPLFYSPGRKHLTSWSARLQLSRGALWPALYSRRLWQPCVFLSLSRSLSLSLFLSRSFSLSLARSLSLFLSLSLVLHIYISISIFGVNQIFGVILTRPWILISTGYYNVNRNKFSHIPCAKFAFAHAWIKKHKINWAYHTSCEEIVFDTRMRLFRHSVCKMRFYTYCKFLKSLLRSLYRKILFNSRAKVLILEIVSSLLPERSEIYY